MNLFAACFLASIFKLRVSLSRSLAKSAFLQLAAASAAAAAATAGLAAANSSVGNGPVGAIVPMKSGVQTLLAE